MSNFSFLTAEFPDVQASAQRAETLVNGDPRASAFYARRTLEIAVKWIFKHDASLNFPYQDNLSALVHEPTFKRAAGDAIISKARLIIKIGNRAVHEARDTPQRDALQAVTDLFHVCFWLARTYARKSPPADGLAFNPAHLSRKDDIVKKAFTRLQQMQKEMEERDENLAQLLRDKTKLDDQLKAMRAEIAEARKQNEQRPDTHDYSEAETRDYFIDVLLKEAGWALDGVDDLEYEVVGMPNNKGIGYVDYVLWGDDGKPLGLVEAKRTKRDPRVGQQQAKLYADCLEAKFGQRPIIFYSNGYDHWIWDDQMYPPRAVQGFLKKDELQLAIQRRTSRKPLIGEPVNKEIAGRYYQTRAIASIAKSFEKDHQRKALLVMATGSGKTRTVIALADLLMRCNWAKRILFLADRVALVNQAVAAFKHHLPDAAPVNLVTDKSAQARVYVSTYPTMMGLIDQKREEGRMFGPGHFDLIVIDEAHRSVYQRYGAIFDYFDNLLVGLTATPKDEIDRNTYGLFDLEDGVPTDAYPLDQAVEDSYLVPPEAISVPLKFQREGIKYDDLSDAEKEEWDMLEWDEDEVPDSVNAEAVNKWLFNTDTVDKVLAHVMTHGLKVSGGDRLGKTIIFAKNQKHAEFIEERFNTNYPRLAGHFARIITFKTTYAQSLIDDFSIKDKDPHIAISVDMLDTGIDVPEVVNLVLFKLIRSKTKFWQILGRGTRLCPDLFGPDVDKDCFYVFDFCQNLEFFSQNPKVSDGLNTKSLSERLFAARFDLVRALDEQQSAEIYDGMAEEGEGYLGPGDLDHRVQLDETTVRDEALNYLIDYVAGMNLDNFIVRPKRRSVEKYQQRDAWKTLSDDKRDELLNEVAMLPSEINSDNEEAKRFDLLMFSLELALLKANKSFDRLKQQLLEIAAALEEQTAIPAIAAQSPLIQDIQTDHWWEGITVPLLELVRLRLRDLVQHIDKKRKAIVYTNFEDDLGTAIGVDLPQVGEVDFVKFKKKARHFLLEHEDHLTLQKLRRGKPLTAKDLDQLEDMLITAGVGNTEQVEKAADLSAGLGRFIRALVGLERAAVVDAFSEFVSDASTTAEQIEFIDMIIAHLTDKGMMDPSLLYESPFTDVAPSGPEQVFDIKRADRLIEMIDELNKSAVV
ncbi:DEAD/DEAH box helicase family protein [Roseibium alexandrii]|uniref:Type I site-specific restriction-modification system, R (Restriction) subunit n=1 Tax=Roseibium alexandrii (strain DSM 17067 / NCIMB 14079 / DFL-11) TaxID=244592 RepID=A0A5E8H5D9_ROSAD|nr:DEAD/DEAH box helicase family protein [Roseibium alexandrii]EEE47200.1 Type I site-specific restriction-modification system, R (restriction) subunit [Roseibium alexandrii DFL-11]